MTNHATFEKAISPVIETSYSLPMTMLPTNQKFHKPL